SIAAPRPAPDRPSQISPKPTRARGPRRATTRCRRRGRRSPPGASDRFPSGLLVDWLRSLRPSGFSLAGQEGFEPPTRGFGDRCSTVGATGLDLSFSVLGVLTAARAEFAQL